MNRKEEMFTNKEFSDNCKEDIYSLLFNIGFVYNEKNKGNIEAFALYEDFVKYLTKEEFPCLNLFYLIETGQIDNNPELSIFSCVGEKLNKSDAEVKQCIDREIDKFLKVKQMDWCDWINKVYKKKLKPRKKKIHRNKSMITDESYWKADYKIKNQLTPMYPEDKDFPEDLEELIAKRNVVLKKIPKTSAGQVKNNLIESSKSMMNEIVNLKEGYGIPIVFQHAKKHTTNLEFDERHYVEEEIDYLEKDMCSLDYIDYVAENNLTETQYLVYQLFFKHGLSNKETAKYMKISRPAITKQTKAIVAKIQKNI